MKSCHVTDDVITLDVTWEDILWQMLSCCGLTVFWKYKIVKVIKLSKKLPQRILGGVFFMIIIIHFYNYYIFFCSDTSNNLTASMENNHSKQGIVSFSSRLRPGPLPIFQHFKGSFKGR